MPSKLTSFQSVQPVSSYLKSQPESVPLTEDLEKLSLELTVAKQRARDRYLKAEEDIKTISEYVRRVTEKEKGKTKAIEKVKRERDFTPLLEAEETRSSGLFQPGSSKSRHPSHPAIALPSSSRSSLDPRRSSAADDLKKKKKKRKREGGDSDVEPELQRSRKNSPPVATAAPHVVPPKPLKPTISTGLPHNKAVAGPDFAVPASVQLLPPQLEIPPPPIPGPSKPTDVMEDFSKAKQPATQVLVSTFYSSIEPYLRNIKEEDVGFLEYTGDEVEPFVMPKLGRHYLEVWDDPEAGLLSEQQLAPPSTFAAPTPKWDPSTLAETDLAAEAKGHGPLTERVICSLLPIADLGIWKGVKAAEDAMEGRPGGSGAAAARRERLNVTDLEARIRDTMRYHGLLNVVPDFTERVDDPIATALRGAQEELRQVMARNKARKNRLIGICRDRLGYQEYIELRDTIDKNITMTYAKLQNKDIPKLNKKKKKPLQGAAAAAVAAAAAAHAARGSAVPEETPAALAPCPAALGLTPDENNNLTVNEQLMALVETRRQWVDTIGSVFEEKERQTPGRIYGLPKESIYIGIDEEVKALLAASAPIPDPPNNSAMNGSSVASSTASSSTNAFANTPKNGNLPSIKINRHAHTGSLKGKEKARGDAMDIG